MEFATTGFYLMIIASVLLFAVSIFMAIQVPKKNKQEIKWKILFSLRLDSLLKLKINKILFCLFLLNQESFKDHFLLKILVFILKFSIKFRFSI